MTRVALSIGANLGDRLAALQYAVDELSALGEVVAGAERQCILRGLARCGGNRSQTAALLGISRKNLWEKMRRHGIGETG